MEYDKTSTPAPAIIDANATTTSSSRGGHIRLQSEPISSLSALAQPLTLPFSGRTVKNRFLKAPMTERLCYWPTDPNAPISDRGVPTPEYTRLYQRWGEGEIGIIVSGNTMVKYDAVEAFGNPIVCDDHDGRVAKYAEVTRVAKKEGSLIVCQISHPGRQGSRFLNPNPVSASDVHLKIKWAGNEFAKPRPMEKEEIKEMVRLWGETAWLCKQAGFDGVQVSQEFRGGV